MPPRNTRNQATGAPKPPSSRKTARTKGKVAKKTTAEDPSSDEANRPQPAKKIRGKKAKYVVKLASFFLVLLGGFFFVFFFLFSYFFFVCFFFFFFFFFFLFFFRVFFFCFFFFFSLIFSRQLLVSFSY